MSFYFSDSSDSQKDALNYFVALGEDYEKYRPIYPDEAMATILSAQFHRKFRGEGGKISLTYQTRLYLANPGYS